MTFDTTPNAPESGAHGPLLGLTILDLSRILAGPTATQLLGDLGATIIKIERPGRGDDTRRWGPPFLKGEGGEDTAESAYYMSANRNKKSLAVDIASPQGQDLLRRISAKADIVIENFKVGDLKRRGLDYETLKALNPGLIYCSITGFGQTGPYAHRAGYDFLAQGAGGIMSLTGLPDEEGGAPVKIGVGVADVMCGMYASNAILAALHYRERTGCGQYIDVSLLDTQVAWLVNQGLAYLTSGEVPQRLGNAHPTIVPYNSYPASDQHFILAVGNDAQFEKFCKVAGCSELSRDPRFARNQDRVLNRKELEPLLRAVTVTRAAAEWIAILEHEGVPCGAINTLDQVFEDPQIQHRGMKVTMPHERSASGKVDLIGNPLKLSETPVTYRHAPPQVGEHTRDVLSGLLGLGDDELRALADDGVIDLGTGA